MNVTNWISRPYRNEPNAEAFADYLQANCDFDYDAVDYPWDAPIPPEAGWADEVAKLNAHIASL